MNKGFLFNINHLFNSVCILNQTRFYSSTSSPSSNKQLDSDKINQKKILEIINSIKDTDSFKIAFTHKSVRFLNSNHESYERLEFFGDSLLEYYTTSFIFKVFPKLNEGDLTQLRSLLVERKNIAKISKQIGLDEYLNLGEKIEKSTKILADIFESFIGALYIEKGEKVLHNFLSLTLFNRSETIKQLKDYELNSISRGDILGDSMQDIKLSRPALNTENVISSNSMKQLTFKFDMDNEDSKDNMVKQINLLDKISNIVENGFKSYIKQFLDFKKEIINIINVFERNFDVKSSKNQLSINDINMVLKNTNKSLHELNNNTLKINNEIIKLREVIFRVTNMIKILVLILILIVAMIAIKLIITF